MGLKIKFIWLAAVLIGSTLTVSMRAQDKSLTLHDVIPGGKSQSRFVPRDLRQLQWNGDEFIYIKGDSMYAGIPGEKADVAFTRKQLNEALEAAGLKTTGSMPAFSVPFKDRPVLAFQVKKHRLLYDWKAGKIVSVYALQDDWKNFDFCTANQDLAFTEGNNVFILSPEGKLTQVTHETASDVVCGQAVHQFEFGIHKGLFWSPSGHALAFYRMDESMVTDYPFVDASARIATAKPHKYPMAGMKSHQVTVGIYYPESGKTVWLKTGLPKEKYLTNIAWSPDGKQLYIAELNRDQNEMNLVSYSAATGERNAVLFTETNERYVEPQNPPLFIPGNPDQFIWQSQRDGFNHLYLYNTKGELIRQLTAGEWLVLNTTGFDESADNLYFSATKPLDEHPVQTGSALNIRTWKLSLKDGTLTPMNREPGMQGVHQAQLSVSGNYLTDKYQAPDVAREITIIDTRNGETINTLLSAANPYKDYALPDIETGTLKAADGVTDLNYRLVKPLNMKAGEKYPVVVYVYGGPHAQLVTGGWMNGVPGWDLYMAQKGYAVFTVDSRGSANRGFDFESVIHRNLGVNEMADQVKGVEYLQSLPFIDADRIGVFGWSYGGFMSTNLMCSYPEIFKVGVAGGPVIDWSNYEIMYGERYMDSPQDNPEGYDAANLTNKADQLQGRLLLIHGDEDPVVVWQHSLKFLKACVAGDTYPDYFVYPGHLHNVTGKDRPHLYEKVTRYFDDFLMNGTSSSGKP